MNLNEKLIYLRKKAGYSQETLAEKLGVSRQAVSKWETGDSIPEVTKIPQLAALYHVTADWLLSEEAPADEGRDTPPAAEEAPPFIPPEVDSARQQETEGSSFLDALPGFLSRMIHRYGWLAGVRFAIGGGVMTLFGLMVHLITGQFFGAVHNYAFDMSPGGFSSEVIFYDTAGNIIDAPAGFDVSALGGQGSFFSSFNASANGMASSMHSIFNIMDGFIILVGVVMLIFGIVLAVYLRRKSDL